MAKIKKQTISSVGEDADNQNPETLRWEYQMVQPLWKTLQQYLLKFSPHTPETNASTLESTPISKENTQPPKDRFTKIP